MTIKKPSPYIPSFLKAALSGSRPLQLTFSDVMDTNIRSTSSFIYDPANAPLKSTQQLNVDWSKFENHTFFMSAEAKVNLSFEQIINGYPFDGTRAEAERFFENLTGFDRWVFDQFPKYHGQLMFSGTQVGEVSPAVGSYITVKDAAGSLYPELSKNKSGDSVLNPKGTSLSIEMQLFVPQAVTSGPQVIIQKISGSTHGFCFYLMPTTSSVSADARFSVISGSSNMTVSYPLDKGKFNHVCVTLNRESGVHYLEFFKDSTSCAVTSTKFNINDMNIDASDLTIGSGTILSLGSTTVTPSQTLSGTIDELRIFHNVRSAEQQELFAQKSIFSTPDLKLYYRFNEPVPPLATSISDQVNSIVIDSSGNSLHSLVSNFSTELRQDASTDPTSNVIYEKQETVPVLFPAYASVISLNTTLLTSATVYDQANPNLITRLIPPHYLLEGAAYEGFDDPEGFGGNSYSGSGLPGQGKLGNVQLFLSMLYIWARFFDEMKLYVDAFSTLRTVKYDQNSSMPNNFLYELVKQFGFHLPPMFNDSTLEQYIRAENIGQEISNSETPLKHVQNELMRRVLVNLPDVLKSKGTQHSIKSFLRAVGIDPENSVRLREFGGPTKRHLTFSRENKRDVGTMVKFSTSSFASSPYLSASRYEPGFPKIVGSFVNSKQFPPNGISNNVNDGLLTSGSWTVEGIFKFTPSQLKTITHTTQSLIRLCTTGSVTSSTGLMMNLLAMSSSVDPKIVLYVRPGDSVSSPIMSMSINMPTRGIFDSERWNLSFGLTRSDDIGSVVSSSYFLRVAKQSNGDIEYYNSTSSFFYEVASGENNSLKKISSSNTSGSFLCLGQQQTIPNGSTGHIYLNNTTTASAEARIQNFDGQASNLRFWSKDISEKEWKEHVKNYKSTGVQDPTVNFNFVKTRSGSFGKLRMDVLTKQDVRRAIATASLGTPGTITFLDFSQNGLHFTGSGFPTTTDCVIGELFDYSHISPYFDEATTNEKVRIRSFQNQDLIDATPWAGTAPMYEIVKSEEPIDDTRFSVEFSLTDALNRDMISMFSTLDSIDNALGNPELMYSPDYPTLETLRNVYFNRIQEKLNFKAFFEFFRWFDMSIGTFIEQLIPRKTRFRGTNYVIESHMFERHKLEYQSSDIYLSEETKARFNDRLLLQQIDGSIRKF